MIHKEEEFTGASCDVCKEGYEAAHTGYTFFMDESNLYEEMTDDGWHVTDDNKHYCPNCHSIDDDDNLTIKEVQSV